jgi:hypothetical protein
MGKGVRAAKIAAKIINGIKISVSPRSAGIAAWHKGGEKDQSTGDEGRVNDAFAVDVETLNTLPTGSGAGGI